jgi:biopolymer transport protein ExbB/TolQ
MSDRFINGKMAVVVGCVLLIVAVNLKGLCPIFMYNPWINALILLTFFGGASGPLIATRRVSSDRRFWHFFKSQTGPGAVPNLNNRMYSPLLSPLVTTLDGQHKSSFTHDEIQHILMSLDRKLSERHAVSRHVIGVLILLGLLGTFWGLTQTVGSIGRSLNGLSFDGSISSDVFQQLKNGIQSPLSGMGVAFSTSIFGLICSMILGFLDLQQGRIEKELYDEVEDGLSSMMTQKLHSPSNSGPAYILALLEQVADVLGALGQRLTQIEDSRSRNVATWQKISETLDVVFHNLTNNQNKIGDLCESVEVLAKNLQNTATNLQNFSEGQVVRNRMEQAKSEQLLEELANGRKQLAQELAGEIRIVARMISMLAEPDESVAHAPRDAAGM